MQSRSIEFWPRYSLDGLGTCTRPKKSICRAARGLRLDDSALRCYRSRKMRTVRPTRPSLAPANPLSMGRAIAAGMTN